MELFQKEHSIDYDAISIHDGCHDRKPRTVSSATQVVPCSKTLKNPATVQDNKFLSINRLNTWSRICY